MHEEHRKPLLRLLVIRNGSVFLNGQTKYEVPLGHDFKYGDLFPIVSAYCGEYEVDYVNDDHLRTVIERSLLGQNSSETSGVHNILLDEKSSDSDKRAFLVTEILNRHHLKTLDDSDDILYYDHGVYRTGGRQTILAELQSIGGFDITNAMRSEVVNTIRAMTYTSRSQFDADPDWLHVANGWLNTRTKEQKSDSHQTLSRYVIPHTFDPSAVNTEQRQFFSEVFEEEDLPALQKFFGYLLLPDNRYKKAFIAVGPKDTGKSIFLHLVEHFAGLASHVSLHDMAKFNPNVATITSSIVNTTSELPKYALKDVSLFKAITGNDERSFREIYGKPFSCRVRSKFVMAANELPDFEDMDQTFIERWVVFRFSNVFKQGEDMDINILTKLVTPEEMSGLLNFAIEGLKKLEDDGYFKNEDYHQLKAKWDEIGSKIRDYVSQHCVKDEKASIYSDALFEHYCRTGGGLSKAIFGREVKRLGIIHRQVRGTGKKRPYVYGGITTRERAEKGLYLGDLWNSGTLEDFGEVSKEEGYSEFPKYNETGTPSEPAN